MELRRYYEIIRPYAWLLAIVPLIAGLIGLGATYLVAPRYVGVAVVQIIPDETESRAVTLRPQDGPGVLATGFRDPTELLAQGIIEILDSRDVAIQVTDSLALDRPTEASGWEAFKSRARALLSDAWTWSQFGFVAPPDQREATLMAVNQSLKAQLVRGSYYMRITGTWRDPQTAAALANAGVEAVLANSRRIANSTATDRRRFLEDQVQEARQRVDSARQELLTYSTTNGLVANESIRRAIAALDTARESRRQLELDLADLQRRLTEAEEQLAATPAEAATTQTAEGNTSPGGTVRTTSPNPAYVALQNTLFMLRQELAALEGRAQPVDAAVRSTLEQSKADLRRRLAEGERQLRTISPTIDSAMISDGTGTRATTTVRGAGPNPIHQSLQERVNSLRQERSAREAQRAVIAQQLQVAEEELRTLTLRDGRLSALNLELSVASDAYVRRTQQWSDALMEEARPAAQLRRIDPALAPTYPVAPIKVLWVVIAAAAGLLVTVLYIFVRSSTDLALRSATEAEAASELPLVGVVRLPERSGVDWPAFGGRRGGGA